MPTVTVERFYLGCLAHASYIIASEGEAAVIDPQRDVDLYLDAAARLGVQIRYVIETHLHADFVSGHVELASRTGAEICLGDGAGADFPHRAVKDGDTLTFGNCRMRFLQTPGHTLESICIVMEDLGDPGRPAVVFTGDTLFIGDVGRPDLGKDHTPQQLAAMLYQSLHDKLLVLPESTEVMPAHGAGSLCGRQMSNECVSTIGREKRQNYALQAATCEEFVQLLTESLPARPEYFTHDVELNRRGAVPLDQLPALPALTPAQVLEHQKQGVVLVDTRPAMEFAVAHVPGAIHIALTGQYASWAARILGANAPIILAGEDDEHVRESQIRLARVGVENIIGYLAGGVAGWIRAGCILQYIPQITAAEFEELRAAEPVTILDVREPGEVAAGAMEGSIRIPLGELARRTSEVPTNQLLVVHCKGGYRSSIATSLLRRAGVENLANLTGGYDAWAKFTQTAPVSTTSCSQSAAGSATSQR